MIYGKLKYAAHDIYLYFNNKKGKLKQTHTFECIYCTYVHTCELGIEIANLNCQPTSKIEFMYFIHLLLKYHWQQAGRDGKNDAILGKTNTLNYLQGVH